MYPIYMLVRIVELPPNGKLKNTYAIQRLANLEEFDYDFCTKSSVKRFLDYYDIESGEYLIIHENDNYGEPYVIDTVCTYRNLERGKFLEFNLPGVEWEHLIKAWHESPLIDLKLDLPIIEKVKVPKVEFI